MGPQEDYIETVVTCEGDFHDPKLQDHLQHFQQRLESLLLEDREKQLILKKVEPWNSVRVTFNIPKEAALRLKQLAEQGSASLRQIGVLGVQIQGDQLVSLTVATPNNQRAELIINTQDGQSHPGASGPSEVPSVFPGASRDQGLVSSSEEQGSPGASMEVTRKNIEEYLRRGAPFSPAIQTSLSAAASSGTGHRVDMFKSQASASVSSFLPNNIVKNEIAGPLEQSSITPRSAFSTGVGGRIPGAFHPVPDGRQHVQLDPQKSVADHVAQLQPQQREQQPMFQQQQLPNQGMALPQTAAVGFNVVGLPPPPPYPHENVTSKPNSVNHKKRKVTGSSPLLVNLLQTDPIGGGNSVTTESGPEGKPKKKRRRRKEKQVSASLSSEAQISTSSIQKLPMDTSSCAFPKSMPSAEDISAVLHRGSSPIPLPSPKHITGFNTVHAGSDSYKDMHTSAASAALASLAQSQRVPVESEQHSGDTIINPYTGHMEPRDSASDLSPAADQQESPSSLLSQNARTISESDLSTAVTTLAAKTDVRAGSSDSLLGLNSVHEGTAMPCISRKEQLREFSASTSVSVGVPSQSHSTERDALIAKHPLASHEKVVSISSPSPVSAASRIYAQHSVDPSHMLSQASDSDSCRLAHTVLTDAVLPASQNSSGQLAHKDNVLHVNEDMSGRGVGSYQHPAYRPQSSLHKNVLTTVANENRIGMNVTMGDVNSSHMTSEISGYQQMTKMVTQKVAMPTDMHHKSSHITSASVHPQHDSLKLLNSSSAILGAAQPFSVESAVNATSSSPAGSKLLSDGDDNSNHSPVSQTDGVAGPSSLLDSNGTKVDHHDSGVGSSSERSDDTTPSEAGDGEFQTNVATTSPSAADSGTGKPAFGARKGITSSEKIPSSADSHSMTVGFVQIDMNNANPYNKEPMKNINDSTFVMGNKAMVQDPQLHLPQLMRTPAAHVTVGDQKSVQVPSSLSMPTNTIGLSQNQQLMVKNTVLTNSQITGIHQNGRVSLPAGVRHRFPLAVQQHGTFDPTIHHPVGDINNRAEGHLGFHRPPNSMHHNQSSPGSVPNNQEQYRPAACVSSFQAVHQPSVVSSRQDLHHVPRMVPQSQSGGHRFVHFPPISSDPAGFHSGTYPSTASSQTLNPRMNHTLSTTCHSTVHNQHEVGASSSFPDYLHNTHPIPSNSQNQRTVSVASSMGYGYSSEIGSSSFLASRAQHSQDRRTLIHNHGMPLGLNLRTEGPHPNVLGHLNQDMKTTGQFLHNNISDGPHSVNPAAVTAQNHLTPSPSSFKPSPRNLSVHGVHPQAFPTQSPTPDGPLKPSATMYDSMQIRFQREKSMASIPTSLSASPMVHETAGSQSLAYEQTKIFNNTIPRMPVSNPHSVMDKTFTGSTGHELGASNGLPFSLTTEEILEEASLHHQVKRASPHQPPSSQSTLNGLDLGSVGPDLAGTGSLGDVDVPNAAFSYNDEVLFDPDEDLALLIGPDMLDDGLRHIITNGDRGLNTETRAGSNITSMYNKRSSPINVNMLNHMYAAGLPQPRRLTESVQRLVKPLPNPENSLLPGRVCKSPSTVARQNSNGTVSPGRASQGGARSPGFNSSLGSLSQNFVEKSSSNLISMNNIDGENLHPVSLELPTSSEFPTNLCAEPSSLPSSTVISAGIASVCSTAVSSHISGGNVNPSHNSVSSGMQQASQNHSTSGPLSPTPAYSENSDIPNCHPLNMPVPALIPPQVSQDTHVVNRVSNCMVTSSLGMVSAVSVSTSVPATRMPHHPRFPLIHSHTPRLSDSVCNTSQRMSKVPGTEAFASLTAPVSSKSTPSPLPNASLTRTAVLSSTLHHQQQHCSLPAVTSASVPVINTAITVASLSSDLSTRVTVTASRPDSPSGNLGPVSVSSTASAPVITSVMTECDVTMSESKLELISAVSSSPSSVLSVHSKGVDLISDRESLADGGLKTCLGHSNGIQTAVGQSTDAVVISSHSGNSTTVSPKDTSCALVKSFPVVPESVVLEVTGIKNEEDLSSSASSLSPESQDSATGVHNSPVENFLSKPPLLHPAPPLTLPAIISSATPPPPPLTPVLPHDTIRKEYMFHPGQSLSPVEGPVELSTVADLKGSVKTISLDCNAADEDSKMLFPDCSGINNIESSGDKGTSDNAVSHQETQKPKSFDSDRILESSIDDSILEGHRISRKRKTDSESELSEPVPKMNCVEKVPEKRTVEEVRGDDSAFLHDSCSLQRDIKGSLITGQHKEDEVKQSENVSEKTEWEKSEQQNAGQMSPKNMTHQHEKNILEATPEEVAKKMAAVTSGNKRKVYYTYVLEKPGQSYFDTPVVTGRTRSQGSKGCQEGVLGPLTAPPEPPAGQPGFYLTEDGSREDRGEGAGPGHKRSTRSLRTKDGSELGQNRRKKTKDCR